MNIKRNFYDNDHYVRSYMLLCKNNDHKTVNNIINDIQSNVNHNIIANKACVSIDTINNTSKLYQQVGGNIMNEISNYMFGGETKQTNKSKAAKINENIENAQKIAETATLAIESANKAVQASKPIAQATMSAISSLKKALKKESESDNMYPDKTKKMNELMNDINLMENEIKKKDSNLLEISEQLKNCSDALIVCQKKYNELKNEKKNTDHAVVDVELQGELKKYKHENELLKNELHKQKMTHDTKIIDLKSDYENECNQTIDQEKQNWQQSKLLPLLNKIISKLDNLESKMISK